MNKKIIFLSEMGWSGFVDRKHTNMRTEFAQMAALKAYHYPLLKIQDIHAFNVAPEKEYDYAVLLVGKGEPFREAIFNMNIVREARKFAKHVFFMQEGPSWVWNDLPVKYQAYHFNLLN